MMALTQEIVHYTLNSGPGLMNRTSRTGFMRGSRNFCQAGGGGGGGGIEARRPENSLDNVFFSHQLILQFTEWIQWFFLQRGGGPTSSRGWGKKLSPADRDSKCGSRGGSGGPPPPWKILSYMGFSKV